MWRSLNFDDRHPVCLVTFNYDTLLEDALRQFDLPVTSLDDYTKKHPFYTVFKLHDSTNWAREVETNAQIEMGPNMDTIGVTNLISNEDSLEQSRHRTYGNHETELCRRSGRNAQQVSRLTNENSVALAEELRAAIRESDSPACLPLI